MVGISFCTEAEKFRIYFMTTEASSNDWIDRQNEKQRKTKLVLVEQVKESRLLETVRERERLYTDRTLSVITVNCHIVCDMS